MQFLGKYWPNNRLTPTLSELTPPLGKPWIRHRSALNYAPCIDIWIGQYYAVISMSPCHLVLFLFRTSLDSINNNIDRERSLRKNDNWAGVVTFLLNMVPRVHNTRDPRFTSFHVGVNRMIKTRPTLLLVIGLSKKRPL